MVTLKDALEHLGFDDYDDVIERKVTRALSTGWAKLRGAVGDDVETLFYINHTCSSIRSSLRSTKAKSQRPFLNYLSTRAPPPPTIFSISALVAIDVSPGVVIANAPCAAP